MFSSGAIIDNFYYTIKYYHAAKNYIYP